MYNKDRSLSSWLKYLEQNNNKKIINLNHVKLLALKLDILHLQSFIFTVSGTNGKGTTCAALERLLLDLGYSVGVYSSPHLVQYIERVRINGLLIPEEQHVWAFQTVKNIKGCIQLTYFEYITLSSLFLFKHYPLDVIILEVGLGGNLDATNIIDSDMSLITNIDIDHTSILGHTRSDIAREKSGIFRSNKISLIGEKNIPDVLFYIAKEKNTILKRVNVDWFYKKHHNVWQFICSNIEINDLPITNISLSNISLALAALCNAKFTINKKIIKKAIPSIFVAGRLQTVSRSPRIILDVSHNPASSLYAYKYIKKINILGNIYAVFGVMRDKDIFGIISPWLKKIDYWYAAPLKTCRTATKKQLMNVLPKHNSCIFNNFHDAFQQAHQRSLKNDIILIFGSFFIVSDFISHQNHCNQSKILKNIIMENICY